MTALARRLSLVRRDAEGAILLGQGGGARREEERAEGLGLDPHGLGYVVAADRPLDSWIVFEGVDEQRLAASGHRLEKEGPAIGAGSVLGGGHARGASAYYQQIVVGFHASDSTSCPSPWESRDETALLGIE